MGQSNVTLVRGCKVKDTEQYLEKKVNIDLSIVIVNHNTRRLLQQCLQSIYDTIDGLNFEIFVVDNASSDGSQDMIRTQFPEVKLIANAVGLGFTRAVNMGLAGGNGNYFLVSHPDIKFLSGTIHQLHAYLSTHAQVGIVGGNLTYPDGSYNPCPIARRSLRRELVDFFSTSFRFISKRWPWLQGKLKRARSSFYWDHQSDTESDVIWNACMMFKREVLETVGNFCEEFYIWYSDSDLCYRAQDAGWQLFYLRDAPVIHYEKQSSDYLDDMEEINYKTTWNPGVEKKVDKDRYTLLKRHYSPAFLWFRKILETASLWRRNIALTLRRVFVSSR